MPPTPLNNSFLARLFGSLWQRPSADFGPRRGQQTHVIILDGTMSSLDEGAETNAGLAYKLCREMSSDLSIYYEPGMQWQDWRSTNAVAAGHGINRQIRRAYGYLASRYRPGDRIFLMGYSRGGYAVRSLAGVIDFIGLLKADEATERNIRDVYRHYQNDPETPAARAFARTKCHSAIPIEMIGVWDTVKSLGVNAPVLWRLSTARHAFHNHELSSNVHNGFQALALDETRVAYRPVMWKCPPGWDGHVEQVWFRGSHGDVGGQLGGFSAARPLANIPLVWMLEQAQTCGLPLPAGWQARYPQDVNAPSVGSWRGYGKIFVTRRKRVVGADRSERIHESVTGRAGTDTRLQPVPKLGQAR